MGLRQHTNTETVEHKTILGVVMRPVPLKRDSTLLMRKQTASSKPHLTHV